MGRYETYAGDSWTCWDTGGGIDCHNTDLVVPGEAWPELRVHEGVGFVILSRN